LNINETIHVSDGPPSLVPATPLNINETIHVSDGTPALALAKSLVISETIHVSDAVPPPAQSIPLNISETIHVSDAVATPSTPPVLTLPSSITVEAISVSGAIVTYTASAFDAVDGVVPVVCSPASGSTFPIGTTTVNCTASDSRHNTSTGSFTVSVVSTTPPINVFATGTLPQGTTSNVVLITLTFNSSTMLGNLIPSTLGAPGNDFAVVSGGTCQIGNQYTAGSSCTAGVTFTPSGPGLIVGQLTATDTTGTVQATANLASVRYR
jgi:hypothetical protein